MSFWSNKGVVHSCETSAANHLLPEVYEKWSLPFPLYSSADTEIQAEPELFPSLPKLTAKLSNGL